MRFSGVSNDLPRPLMQPMAVTSPHVKCRVRAYSDDTEVLSMRIVHVIFTNGLVREYLYTLPESTWIKKLDADCERDGLVVCDIKFLSR